MRKCTDTLPTLALKTGATILVRGPWIKGIEYDFDIATDPVPDVVEYNGDQHLDPILNGL